jgi:hypothetical protein
MFSLLNKKDIKKEPPVVLIKTPHSIVKIIKGVHREVEITHYYHSDGFHRVVTSNEPSFKNDIDDIHNMDLSLHGPCLCVCISPSEKEKLSRMIKNVVRKYSVDVVRMYSVGRDSEGAYDKLPRGIKKRLSIRLSNAVRSNSVEEILGYRGKQNPDKKFKVSFSIEAPRGMDFHRIEVLDLKRVSSLGLNSKKIWFAVTESIYGISRRNRDSIKALQGFRRVPRKWVKEFDSLLIPQEYQPDV